MKLITTIRDEARDEAYEYFDKNIRLLTKTKDGKVDPTAFGLENNAVGREYGKRAKTRTELLKLIHKALDDGELIIKLEDKRKYQGYMENPLNKSRPLIVLDEDENGRNILFLNTLSGEVLSREETVQKIHRGELPDYTVKMITGIETPVSKPDSRKKNNLG